MTNSGSYPWGVSNPGSRGGAVVLVDQSAESVTALDLSGGRWTGGAHWVGRLECETAVRTLAVVMIGVNAEHPFEVAAAENQ